MCDIKLKYFNINGYRSAHMEKYIVTYMLKYMKYIFAKNCIVFVWLEYILHIFSEIYSPKYIWHILFQGPRNIFSCQKVVYVAYIFHFHEVGRHISWYFLEILLCSEFFQKFLGNSIIFGTSVKKSFPVVFFFLFKVFHSCFYHLSYFLRLISTF